MTDDDEREQSVGLFRAFLDVPERAAVVARIASMSLTDLEEAIRYLSDGSLVLPSSYFALLVDELERRRPANSSHH